MQIYTVIHIKNKKLKYTFSTINHAEAKDSFYIRVDNLTDCGVSEDEMNDAMNDEGCFEFGGDVVYYIEQEL